MAKIKLRREKLPDGFYRTAGESVVQWKSALPFFFNRRGLLVHRVRSALTFTRDGNPRHSSIRYLCSNSGCLDNGELLAEPPIDRLLCAVCEAHAIAHGMPSAEQLTGRHCHVGKLRAERVCCRDELESN